MIKIISPSAVMLSKLWYIKIYVIQLPQKSYLWFSEVNLNELILEMWYNFLEFVLKF